MTSHSDRPFPPGQETGTRWDADLEQQLCYEVKTFLLAGHETSAAMLCWSVFELTQSQEYMNKVIGQMVTYALHCTLYYSSPYCTIPVSRESQPKVYITTVLYTFL